jgi:hypothetical protein
MSVGLIILLAVVAWALGPVILRWAGGLMATAALLLWAIPMGTRTSAIALIVTSVSGVLMWQAGNNWRGRRHGPRYASGRLSGWELVRRGTVRLRHRRNMHDGHAPAGEPYPLDQCEPGNAPYREMWDEDVIVGVAYDIEPGDRW